MTAIFDRTGTMTPGSNAVFEELEAYELNFWQCLRRWDAVDAPNTPAMTGAAALSVLQRHMRAMQGTALMPSSPLATSLVALGGSPAPPAPSKGSATATTTSTSASATATAPAAAATTTTDSTAITELLVPSSGELSAVQTASSDKKKKAGASGTVLSARGRSMYKTYAISAIGRLSSVFSAILYLHGRAEGALRAAERGLSASAASGDALGEANNRKVIAVLYSLSVLLCLCSQISFLFDRCVQVMYYSSNSNREFLLDQARKSLGQCQVLYRSVNSVLGGALTLSALGFVHNRLTNLKGAKNCYEKAAALFKSLNQCVLSCSFTLYFVYFYFGLIVSMCVVCCV
jgi:hypothetical protein